MATHAVNGQHDHAQCGSTGSLSPSDSAIGTDSRTR